MVSWASAGALPGSGVPSSARNCTSAPPAGARNTSSATARGAAARGCGAAFGAVRRMAFGFGTTFGLRDGFAVGLRCAATFFLAAISSREQQAPRLLEVLLDDVHPARAGGAVDDAVVDRHRQVHLLADDDLAVLDDRRVLDRVHAEDRDLGEVDDGRREQAADVAGVGDRERAAGQIVDGDL